MECDLRGGGPRVPAVHLRDRVGGAAVERGTPRGAHAHVDRLPVECVDEAEPAGGQLVDEAGRDRRIQRVPDLAVFRVEHRLENLDREPLAEDGRGGECVDRSLAQARDPCVHEVADRSRHEVEVRAPGGRHVAGELADEVRVAARPPRDERSVWHGTARVLVRTDELLDLLRLEPG
jgi:hypothetical protein